MYTYRKNFNCNNIDAALYSVSTDSSTGEVSSVTLLLLIYSNWAKYKATAPLNIPTWFEYEAHALPSTDSPTLTLNTRAIYIQEKTYTGDALNAFNIDKANKTITIPYDVLLANIDDISVFTYNYFYDRDYAPVLFQSRIGDGLGGGVEYIEWKVNQPNNTDWTITNYRWNINQDKPSSDIEVESYFGFNPTSGDDVVFQNNNFIVVNPLMQRQRNIANSSTNARRFLTNENYTLYKYIMYKEVIPDQGTKYFKKQLSADINFLDLNDLATYTESDGDEYRFGIGYNNLNISFLAFGNASVYAGSAGYLSIPLAFETRWVVENNASK